jgi:hypothetical protein
LNDDKVQRLIDSVPRLIAIGADPARSWHNRLAALRMGIRRAEQTYRTMKDVCAQHRQLLQAHLPFTKLELEAHDEGHRRSRDAHRKLLTSLGSAIRDSGDEIDAALGFDGICDALSVNPVHRAQVRADATSIGLFAGIALIQGMEDSAHHLAGRKERDCTDAPLFNAYRAAVMDFLRRRPDAMPDPFAPGAPLHGMPTYHPTADGRMARKPPALSVHSRSGTKVVDRPASIAQMSGKRAAVVLIDEFWSRPSVTKTTNEDA